jgi:hypothetical protein
MNQKDDANEEAPPITWDIRREGRAWTAEEFTARADRLLGVEFFGLRFGTARGGENSSASVSESSASVAPGAQRGELSGVRCSRRAARNIDRWI